MPSQARALRRAIARQALKAARKAGFPLPLSAATPATVNDAQTATTQTFEGILESSLPLPSSPEMSPAPEETAPTMAGNTSSARVTANRINAQFSTGPKTATTRSISAQNHTLHGLARHHNGTFKLTASEDPAGFEALKQSLVAEHLPASETESILVLGMAESHWLANRAGQLLQDTSLDPNTGAITNEKTFSLYMRYQTTHTRAFHKCLNDLLKLRAERRKADVGFEAQRVQNEKNEMKKQAHHWEVLKKDAQTRHQVSLLAQQNCNGRRQIRGFEEEYEAQLAKLGVETRGTEAATQAA